MKKAIILLAILAWTIPSLAEFNGLPDNVKANLGAIAKYPRNSSILLWCSETYILNADGTQGYEWHSFRYLADDAGRDAWGDPHVAYIDGTDKLEILAARTYTKDGRQINSTPNNAFNPIVPEGFDLAPDYSDLRQMVITMLGLEDGCISELHYRLTMSKPVVPWVEGHVYFREEFPVISRELTVRVPQGTTLNHKEENGIQLAGQDGSTYVWKTSELAGYLREDLAGHRVLLPNVAFSTAKDWATVQSEFTRRVSDARKPPIEIPGSLAEAVAADPSFMNRIETIKAWARERFNVLEFESPAFDVRLRNVDQVFQSGYGNGFELAVMIASLAEQNAMQCQPIAWLPFEPAVPGLGEISGWLIRIENGSDQIRFTDAWEPIGDMPRLAGTSGYYLTSESATPLAGAVRWEALQSESYVTRNSMNLAVNLKSVDGDTLQGSGMLAAQGAYTPYEQLLGTEPAEYLKGIVHLPEFSATNVAIKRLGEDEVELTFDFSAANRGKKDDDLAIETGIFDFASFVPGAPLGLTTREFPQEIPVAGAVTFTLAVPYSGDWNLETRPGGGESVWGKCRGNVISSAEAAVENDGTLSDRRVVLKRTLELNSEWIAPEYWKNFRDWLLYNGSQAAGAVVLKKAEK